MKNSHRNSWYQISPNLRTMASASGDKGRDSELFSPIDDPSVMLQYSVTEGWLEKIRETARRLKAEFPDVFVLIYATSQEIGAKADDLKKELRKKYRLALDIRDREWFLERRKVTNQTQSASQHLISKIADPIVASRKIIRTKSSALTSIEARAALVYLALQWEDDTREKGLTKLCFEALARAVLRETDSQHRLTREEVRSRVRRVLYNHPATQVDQYTDAALSRLNKRFVRHWRKLDEFCLTYEESLRLRDRLTQLEHYDRELQEDLVDSVSVQCKRLNKRLNSKQREAIAERLRRIIEKIFLGQGELFVSSIRTGNLRLPERDMQEIVVRDLGDFPDTHKIGVDLVAIVAGSLTETLASPRESSHRYLRSLSDSYTLMAFLRETPDVQSAVTKMFSEGSVWLDTNIVLPLLAENLLDPAARKYQNLIRAGQELGIKLHVTSGVVEELERHMNRCITYMRSPATWEGRTPFLADMYSATGRPSAAFASWIELFRGDRRPEEDIADYLEEQIGVARRDLSTDAAPDDLRIAVQEIFHEAKERKVKAEGGSPDPISLRRLVMHDVEGYVGVIVRRRQEKSGPFGYSAWWLTLDRTAFAIEGRLKGVMKGTPPASPVMSPDFLVNYLAFGPRRGRISKVTEGRLPLSLGIGAIDYMPTDLLTLAEDVRDKMETLPDHVIRRRVRDEFDAAKTRHGPLVYDGFAHVESDLLQELSRKRERVAEEKKA